MDHLPTSVGATQTTLTYIKRNCADRVHKKRHNVNALDQPMRERLYIETKCSSGIQHIN